MTLKSISIKAALAATLFLAGTAASFAASAYATGEVNVRRGPGTSYGVVDQLYRGESVDVRGCEDGWCRITHSGPDGWVSASYLARDRYNDDYDVDFYIDAPRVRPLRPLRPFRPWRDNSVCIGGPNASFCVYD
jgi:uncharacterized protein YraI